VVAGGTSPQASRAARVGSAPRAALPAEVRAAVEVLWAYHDLGHDEAPTDVAIGLGSHDLGVATCAAGLHLRGMVRLVLFTGANAPSTVERFPRGEAVHYRDHALSLGVPDAAVLVEPTARNTGENITRSRDLLAARGVPVRTVTLVSRPYQQRRAYATCRRLWPQVEPRCASLPQTLDGYLASIGDTAKVVSTLVGDTQRIWRHADAGFAVPQPVPSRVRAAFDLLVAAGYTARLLP
jgi:uncharacterized SAM-binding protein YcdF (DUF218 family)